MQGPRTYTLVKVLTDAGVYGIGEGYGSPGVGIKEGVLELREYFLGKDPLDIEALYLGLGQRVDGSAHMLLRAVSGIEPALWDVAGSCSTCRPRHCWAASSATACACTTTKARATCSTRPVAATGRPG